MGYVLVDIVGSESGEVEVLDRQVGIGFLDVWLIQSLGENNLTSFLSNHLENPDANVAEAGGGGSVAGVADLAGLALAAVRRAPHRPVVSVADGVA